MRSVETGSSGRTAAVERARTADAAEPISTRLKAAAKGRWDAMRERRGELTGFPEEYGHWLLVAGWGAAWTVAVALAISGQAAAATAFVAAGALALGGVAFHRVLGGGRGPGLAVGEVEQVMSEIEVLPLDADEHLELRRAALRELAKPDVRASLDPAREAVRRALAERDRAAAEIADQLAAHFQSQGYEVSRDGAAEQTLVAEKDGDLQVADVHASVLTLHEADARELAARTPAAPGRKRHRMVAVPAGALVYAEARELLAEEKIELVKVDPRSGEVVEL